MTADPHTTPGSSATTPRLPERTTDAEPVVVEYRSGGRVARGPSRAFRIISSPLGTLIPVLGVLLLWEIGSRSGIIDDTFFPAPSDSLAALFTLSSNGDLWPNIGVSIRRITLGFLLGVIPGIAVGIAMARLKWARVILDPLIAVAYPIPVVAILPMLLVIFGIGSTPIIVLAGIISFFPAVVNSMAGVRQGDERLILMAQNMGADRRQVLLRIVLPGALPSIFAGIRLAAGLALLGVIAGEFLAASDGIGSLTWRYWQIYQIDNMYATLAVIAAMGFLLTTALLRVQRRFFGWTEGTTR
ncbi:ABC transporter permease [Nakamurella flavida]|uniref:ABC transporter permease n=1 Tax=Nakamurella flavida TaxID=363630 RepID=A0A938YKY4_9ACTN|nr:ABC transporter permease [Nakamurella flavida]MBM9475332.1 ABC transporter permease [Nakamurella flavida]MDP9776906.1 NitT/TauT family transport system permease protein [Nakamurella flavida]